MVIYNTSISLIPINMNIVGFVVSVEQFLAHVRFMVEMFHCNYYSIKFIASLIFHRLTEKFNGWMGGQVETTVQIYTQMLEPLFNTKSLKGKLRLIFAFLMFPGIQNYGLNYI